jgi:hypothetical protein
MSLLQQKTQLEIDLAEKDFSLIRCAEAAHHLAVTLRRANDQFWSLPTDRLLAVLNADVPATQATFAANTEIGLAVNNVLDQVALPNFASRAPITAGRSDIEFDGNEFIYVAPPAPEPTPEPEPEA